METHAEYHITPTAPVPANSAGIVAECIERAFDDWLRAQDRDRLLTLKDAFTAGYRAVPRVAALHPSEVAPMSLSAAAIKLAHRYFGIVQQYEDPDAYRDSGYTPREMELRRRRAHEDFLNQLRDEGIDTSDRSATTELARLVDDWLRD